MGEKLYIVKLPLQQNLQCVQVPAAVPAERRGLLRTVPSALLLPAPGGPIPEHVSTAKSYTPHMTANFKQQECAYAV